MESLDMTKANIDKIAELFPQVVTEVADPTGAVDENNNIKTVKAIDFEKLKLVLSAGTGDYVVADDERERYEFTWVGKRQAMIDAATPIRKTLRPCPEESKDWATTENLYIEGDNLEVLKLLQESYLGKVNMIYIDPPYNTGKDFIYKDNFAQSREEYEEELDMFDEEGNRLFQNTETNGRFHSDWCSMIYPRLQLARNLLTDDGVIFISIDDNEVSNLKAICDEIFGISNFIDVFNWTKTETPENLSKKSKQMIEYILCYQRKKNEFKFQGLKKKSVSSNGLLNQPNAVGVLTFPAKVVTTSIQDGKIEAGKYGTDSYDVELLKDTEVKEGVFIKEIKLKAKFKWSQEYLNKEISNGTKIRIPKITFSPSYEKLEYDPEVPANLINSKVGVDTNEVAGNHQLKLFDKKVFNFPKPVSLIKYLLGFNDDDKSDYIVMDFFSGSATTAEAVMEINAEDKSKKLKYILVQIAEDLNDSLKKASSQSQKEIFENAIDLLDSMNKPRFLTELGKERIRRAGAKITEEQQAKNDGLFAEDAKPLDIGFRVFKLDTTNMKDVYYAAGELSQKDLWDTVSNIKDDRSDIDLLYGCLLDWGVQLTMPQTTEQIENFTVHTVDSPLTDGIDLIACFDSNVSETVVRTIAKRKPTRALFRDSSFADSANKINVFEIFKSISPDTTVKVI